MCRVVDNHKLMLETHASKMARGLKRTQLQIKKEIGGQNLDNPGTTGR